MRRLSFILLPLLVLTLAVPASADTTTTTSLPVLGLPTTTALSVPTTAGLSAPTTTAPLSYESSYTSLAAAMVSVWAAQSGQTLSSWTQANSTQMTSMLGASVTGSSLSQLTSELTGTSAGLNLSGVSTPASLLSSISGANSTLDGQATLSGMNLAQSLAGLHSSTAKSASSDSAIFGLFYDQSLTNALKSNPNIFAKAGTAFSASAQGAWTAAMGQAASSTALNVAGLPDPCLVGMLTAMGTGVAGGTAGEGSSCGPCDVAGTYLNTQMSKIWNPSSNNLLASNGGMSTDAWTQLQGWLSSGTLAQNPGLSSTAAPTITANLTSCSASSSATQGALGQTLPGVFGNLGK